MVSEKTSTSVGFPLDSILTIIFVTAKIFGKISWSWWWVFSPLWISAGLAIAVIIFILFLAIIAEFI